MQVYRDSRYFWDVIILVRRAMIIAVASLSTADRGLRLTYLSVVNTLLLLLQVAAAPFQGDLDNLAETLTLTVLSLLTILLATVESPIPLAYIIGLAALIFATFAFFIVKIIYSRSLGVRFCFSFLFLFFFRLPHRCLFPCSLDSTSDCPIVRF
jgi:hypothetical protein